MAKNDCRFFLVPVCMLVVASFAFAAYERNYVYKTPVALWADAASKAADKRRAHQNYGEALSEAGTYDEALKQFQTVLALKDDGRVPLRDLYREIGMLYFRMERYDEAAAAWQTGLLSDPLDPSLLTNIAVVLFNKGRYDEAEAMVRQGLKTAPPKPQLLNILGRIQCLKGQYEEGLKSFLAAVESAPDSPTQYWNAAVAFEQTGRCDKAYEYAGRFAAMVTGPERQQAMEYRERMRQLQSPKCGPQ